MYRSTENRGHAPDTARRPSRSQPFAAAPLALLALLSACAQPPRHDEARAERDSARLQAARSLPSQYAVAAGTAPPATAAAPAARAGSGWAAFGDAELTRLVDAALAHNADLLAARARIDEAAALLREVGAASLPSLDLAASGSRGASSLRTATPVPASARVASSQRLALASAFEIDLWGRLRATQSAAQAQWLAAQHARDGLQLSLAAQVAQAYVSLRALDAQLALSEAAAQTRRQTLARVEQRVAAGVSAALERHAAEAALAELGLQAEDLRRQRSQTAHALALLCGRPALPAPVASASGFGLPAAPALPAPGLPAELLQRRADVRQAEEQLAAAGAQIAVARAAAYPSLTLSASFGGQSAELADLLASGARVWSLAAALAAPIFDGGRSEARVEQAEARREQALAAYLKTAQTAYREAADALAALAANQAQQADAERRVRAAERTLELVRLRVDAGVANTLERLDAEHALLDARATALRHAQARLAATIDLVKALGGGWAAAAAPAAG
jgi:multidrug efflux system outer membrane protein